MNISPRVKDIIMEATSNNTISAISMVEREEIAALNEDITGEEINKWCNACIVKACYTIKRRFDNDKDNHRQDSKKRKGKKQDGRGSGTLRNRTLRRDTGA